MAVNNAARHVVRLILRLLGGLLLLLVLFFGFSYSTPPLGETWTAIGILARDHQFDYISWELQAVSVKLQETLWGLHPFMREADRQEFVRDYMRDVGRAEALEGEIAVTFADPRVIDPVAVIQPVRQQLDELRADLLQRQGLAEAILEGQIATVLVEEGFGIAGQLLPPIAAHFTQVPNLLVVSPRDRIQFDVSMNLDAMSVDEIDALEGEIDATWDVSSLVVPLGGIALYPSMILESPSIPYALEVISHEWLHHYLFAFPLGYSYDFAGEARIINETTASIFGQEMGRRVLERYYPDLVPPPPAPPDPSQPESANLPSPSRFNFGTTMNETRIHVDELLAAGQVEEAEAYMEQQRQLFIANGYILRKLNQAFFAFYGGYQSGTPGEGGRDPIGPAVQDIRRVNGSLFRWVEIMRQITTRDQLVQTRDDLLFATHHGP